MPQSKRSASPYPVGRCVQHDERSIGQAKQIMILPRRERIAPPTMPKPAVTKAQPAYAGAAKDDDAKSKVQTRPASAIMPTRCNMHFPPANPSESARQQTLLTHSSESVPLANLSESTAPCLLMVNAGPAVPFLDR